MAILALLPALFSRLRSVEPREVAGDETADDATPASLIAGRGIPYTRRVT
jgi:hypothetical protein